MLQPSGRRLSPEVWEVLSAAVVLTWRIAGYPASTLWRDWVVLIAGFWIVTALAGRSKAWPALLGLLMAFLFVLYSLQQIPQSLALLGALR